MIKIPLYKQASVLRITNRTCLKRQFEEIPWGIPKFYQAMGLEPSSHTPELNQIEAGQSQPAMMFLTMMF